MKKTILFVAIPLLLIIVTVGWFKVDQSNNEKEINAYLSERVPKSFGDKTSVEMRSLLPNDPTTENITQASDLIVQGTIESIGQPYKTDQGEVYHDITVVPDKAFKDNFGITPGQSFKVVVQGGETNDAVYWGLNIPSFKGGEKVILFLGKVDQTGLTADYFISYDAFGKLLVENEKVHGINHEDGLVDMGLEQYINKLQDIISAQK